MFVYNNCAKDVRVLKEAATLTQAGYDVRIVAVLDKTTAPREERDGFVIVRIDRDPIHYRLLRFVRGRRRAARLVRAGVRRQGSRAVRRAGLLADNRRLWMPLMLPLGLAWRLLRPIVEVATDGLRAVGPVLPRHLRKGAGAPGTASEPAERTSRAQAAVRFVGRTALFPARLLLASVSGGWRGANTHGYRMLMRFHKPFLFLDYYLRAYRYVREEPADAYHAHDLNTLPVAAALAGRVAGQLVYDSHELYPEVSTLSKTESRIWRIVERRLIGRADGVVTVCGSIADELSRRHGIDRPLVVLNTPLRQARAGSIPNNLLREKVGMGSSSEPIVLYHGGFVPYRGLDALLAAAPLLDRGVIVLMGWGRLEEELRETLRAEGLEGRVIITPPVPSQDVVAYAAGADIGVIPYEAVGLNNYYTAPNKLFDYMAVGLAIAASRLPELERFLRGYDVGLTFTPGDARSLADTLNTLLADEALRRRMGANGLTASREFCWEVESAKLLELYERGLPSR